MKRYFSLIIHVFLSISCLAQHSQLDLAKTVEKCNYLLIKGTPEDIRENFPLPEQQSLLLAIQKGNYQRSAGISEILSFSKDSALVLLTGTFLLGNSGDETDYCNVYSGVYVFKPAISGWKMVHKIPIDRLNRLESHRMFLQINPEDATITVKDTMNIQVLEKHGFAFALNHNAIFDELNLDGRKAEYFFDGGMALVKCPLGKHVLSVSYKLKIDHDKNNANSGYFDNQFGHVRDQFYWHPFFNFSSSNDLADFLIRAAIPSKYRLTTGLPQTEQVIGQERKIHGKSAYPTSALSFYYDSEWSLKHMEKDNYSLNLFTGEDFKPTFDTLSIAFSKTYDMLSDKFGRPSGNYLAIAQNRSKDFPIWLNRSNDMIVAGREGVFFISNKPGNPSAPFGHEVAHAWTRPVGPATNFLREGWASFAEIYLLEKTYSDTTAKRLMLNYKSIYFRNGYDGKSSLALDNSNDGVSYYKGVWVFYMLREALGEKEFYNGMKDFMDSTSPMSIQRFIQCLSTASGRDLTRVIKPWIVSTSVPTLTKSISDGQLVITQLGDVFSFPLHVAFHMKDGGIIKRKFNLTEKLSKFKLDNIYQAEISSVELDPDDKLLIKNQ